jgi:hypothetical protein
VGVLVVVVAVAAAESLAGWAGRAAGWAAAGAGEVAA